MPLYKISSTSKISQLKPSTFRNERSLQELFEGNLDILLGVRFIASEFSTGDRQRGRIDTLGLDEDGSPTIIEYKKTSKDNVINQGLFYLDWLVDHQGDFTLAAREAFFDDIDIDWSHPRLILIAESFSRYDEFAVNRIGANIELWEYRRYSDNMLYLEPMFVTQKSRVEIDTSDDAQEIPIYTIDDHLEGKNRELANIFSALQERIMGLDEDGDISERPLKTYIGYKHGTNFCEVRVQTNEIKLWVDIAPSVLDDPFELGRDVTGIGHYGTGDIEVRLSDLSNLNNVMYLIEQSYQQTL